MAYTEEEWDAFYTQEENNREAWPETPRGVELPPVPANYPIKERPHDQIGKTIDIWNARTNKVCKTNSYAAEAESAIIKFCLDRVNEIRKPETVNLEKHSIPKLFKHDAIHTDRLYLPPTNTYGFESTDVYRQTKVQVALPTTEEVIDRMKNSPTEGVDEVDEPTKVFREKESGKRWNLPEAEWADHKEDGYVDRYPCNMRNQVQRYHNLSKSSIRKGSALQATLAGKSLNKSNPLTSKCGELLQCCECWQNRTTMGTINMLQPGTDPENDERKVMKANITLTLHTLCTGCEICNDLRYLCLNKDCAAGYSSAKSTRKLMKIMETIPTDDRKTSKGHALEPWRLEWIMDYLETHVTHTTPSGTPEYEYFDTHDSLYNPLGKKQCAHTRRLAACELNSAEEQIDFFYWNMTKANLLTKRIKKYEWDEDRVYKYHYNQEMYADNCDDYDGNPRGQMYCRPVNNTVRFIDPFLPDPCHLDDEDLSNEFHDMTRMAENMRTLKLRVTMLVLNPFYTLSLVRAQFRLLPDYELSKKAMRASNGVTTAFKHGAHEVRHDPVEVAMSAVKHIQELWEKCTAPPQAHSGDAHWGNPAGCVDIKNGEITFSCNELVANMRKFHEPRGISAKRWAEEHQLDAGKFEWITGEEVLGERNPQ